MAYTLGKRSRKNLEGVHPNLVKIVELAIKTTKQDFTVIEGVRTLERQKNLVKTGASKTLNSKHLRQTSGYGHAVDLVPYGDFDGNGTFEISWHAGHFYPIAEAMRYAAKALNIKIRWGGSWSILNDTTEPAGQLVAKYAAERRKQGKSAFIDCPHFELYP